MQLLNGRQPKVISNVDAMAFIPLVKAGRPGGIHPCQGRDPPGIEVDFGILRRFKRCHGIPKRQKVSKWYFHQSKLKKYRSDWNVVKVHRGGSLFRIRAGYTSIPGLLGKNHDFVLLNWPQIMKIYSRHSAYLLETSCYHTDTCGMVVVRFIVYRALFPTIPSSRTTVTSPFKEGGLRLHIKVWIRLMPPREIDPKQNLRFPKFQKFSGKNRAFSKFSNFFVILRSWKPRFWHLNRLKSKSSGSNIVHGFKGNLRP